MTERRDQYYRQTIGQWMDELPGDLFRDATGLWEIVSFGRQGFGLSGSDLVDFVKRGVLALLAKGAKPVTGASDGTHIWQRLYGYGEEPEQMADAIVEEWQRAGRDPDYGGVWFATPNVYEERRPGR